MMKYSEIIQWSVEEVVIWLCKRGFDSLSQAFMDQDINGDTLFQLTERDLSVLVKNGIQRKRLWRDLRTLMRNIDYSDSFASETALMLANISPDLVEYTHKLVSAGLDSENIENVGGDVETNLRLAGVENLTHLLKIKDALERIKHQKERVRMRSILPNNVYIITDSKSKTFASLVEIYLQLRGHHVIRNSFSLLEADHESIMEADTVVAVLQKESCEEVEDLVLDEIEHVQKCDKNLVMVVEEVANIAHFWDNIKNMEEIKVIRWIHDYQEAAVDKIENQIQQVPCCKSFNHLRSISMDSGIDSCF